MKNKYVNRSRISEAKFRELVKYFALDLDAYKIAALTGLNRNTVNRYTRLIRERIAEACDRESPFILRELKTENVCAPADLPGSARNTLFGITERNAKIYTEVVPEENRELLQAAIRGKVAPETVVGSSGYHWRGYDGLVDLKTKKHYLINRKQSPDSAPRTISRVESFWAFAKKRMLLQFQGVPESTFHLHLKECEFRFNNRDRDIYTTLLQMLRENPLD